MNLCWHHWLFPRRYERFGELRNVDVQSCRKCGRQRVSRVQFGAAPESLALHASAKFETKEVSA